MFAVLDEMDNLEKSIMIHDEQELSFSCIKIRELHDTSIFKWEDV